MKKVLLLASLMSVSTLSSAYDGPGQPISGPEQHCYGMAMVGFDSVINSRLGVLPEHVLGLAELKKVKNGIPTYQPYLLKVVLDAYLWDESPHNYAIKVMYNCAMNDAGLQTAGVQGDPVSAGYFQ